MVVTTLYQFLDENYIDGTWVYTNDIEESITRKLNVCKT
jgi:hypothetical protein